MKSGTRLGHYEIGEPLGAGGMGEVYRARDTNLDREVAVKVLPEDFAADPERLARFEREAKLLGSLNHPNIATIHGFEESEGVRFIAMELVEGDSLAERIAATGIKVDEALEIARRIALAFEAAHQAGVIHRDLKPANVQVTSDGAVKVLDFGLAKAYETDGSGSGATQQLSESPTMMAATGTGVILGTAPYMSPEQVRGKPLDKRTDIWAFGCVLYEMLTGNRAFDGETVGDTMAAILKEEPDWALLPATTPRAVRRLLGRCLAKEPKERLHDFADARINIVNAIESPDDDLSLGQLATAATASHWRLTAPIALAALVVGALVGRMILPQSASDAESPSAHLLLELESGLYLAGGHPLEESDFGVKRPTRTALAVSPDGQQLVYSASDGQEIRLYQRALNRPRATPILGTETGTSPFFSPDGEWVGFFALSDGSVDLKKVPIAGGEPRTLLPDAGFPRGASWGADENIIFSSTSDGGRLSLYRVPASGGSKELLADPDALGERGYVQPHLLPGADTLLFTVLGGRIEDNEIVAQRLDNGERKTLVTDGFDARYVPTGHIVFARSGALMAVAFDPESLDISGDPVVAIEEVNHAIYAWNGGLRTGAAQVAISNAGALSMRRAACTRRI